MEYHRITMPTITVKLDTKRAARLARWACRNKVPKVCWTPHFLVALENVEEFLEGAVNETVTIASRRK
jgi:hypothetical protein